MKVKDVDALREQIFHDPRKAFTKHEVWLFASEHNNTTPTFDAVPVSVLKDIKAEIAQHLQIMDICRVEKENGVIVQSESTNQRVVRYDSVMQIIDKHMESEDNK